MKGLEVVRIFTTSRKLRSAIEHKGTIQVFIDKEKHRTWNEQIDEAIRLMEKMKE